MGGGAAAARRLGPNALESERYTRIALVSTTHTSSPTRSYVQSCRMYVEKFPEVDDVVMVQVGRSPPLPQNFLNVSNNDGKHHNWSSPPACLFSSHVALCTTFKPSSTFARRMRRPFGALVEVTRESFRLFYASKSSFYLFNSSPGSLLSNNASLLSLPSSLVYCVLN